jgi:hypothetical protein
MQWGFKGLIMNLAQGESCHGARADGVDLRY